MDGNGANMKIKFKVKHNATSVPGIWGDSCLIFRMKADKSVVDRVEEAIKNALAVRYTAPTVYCPIEVKEEEQRSIPVI
jgi:hypothetical protein